MAKAIKKRKPLKKRKPEEKSEERLVGKSVVDIIEPKTDKKVKKRDKVDKKKVVEEADALDAYADQATLLERYQNTPKMPKDFTVEAKNYRWSLVKGIGDYVGPGVFRAIDPGLKHSDYPANFITDPLTGTELQRVKSYDRFCPDNWIMFKAKRKKYLAELGESAKVKDVRLLEKHKAAKVSEVEYFSVFNQRQYVYAISYGSEGQLPPWGGE